VFARQYGAAGIHEHFSCGRTEQHAAEAAGMRGHDDEIKGTRIGHVRDFVCYVAEGKKSVRFSNRELSLKEGIQPLLGEAPVLFIYFGTRPHVDFESVVAREIRHMKQCHPRFEDRRSPAHIAGHRRARGREVHGEEDFSDHRRSSGVFPITFIVSSCA
jgi:hypothetical protein